MALIGLEKLYYALLNQDDANGISYANPVYMPGVKEIGVVPKVTTEKLFAENQLWESSTALDEVEVSINIADLTNTMLAVLTGHTVAAEGGIYATSEDNPPYVALLYKANKSNGESRYQVLYKGKFELPQDSSKGKEGKVEFQTPQIRAIFQPLQNNKRWKYQVDTDDANCPVDIDTTFFASVIMPGADSAVPTVTSSPTDGATGVAADANVVFTFSKAVDANTVNASNVFLMKSDGTLISAALGVSGESKVITLNPASNLDAGTYVAVCTTGVKTPAGISAASSTVVNFTV